MKLYSTNNKNEVVNLAKAVMQGLPEDNGLYMPVKIPTLPPSFWAHLPEMDLPQIGKEVCYALFEDEIPKSDIDRLVDTALYFPAPVVPVEKNIYSLELFHGPTLAFKDFGARFMAQLMGYFNQKEERDLVILVATSGDTGGAVAAGFYQTPGIKVVILYPSGKVSALQEKQLTTLGHNITALEVDGTFDDCQALVKKAFLDTKLQDKIRLSSANSINIARLIPQSFYYIDAYRQITPSSLPIVVAVPSGNFGNLTAGLLAQKMGLPIAHFIAATNENKVVPDYLNTGTYTPRPSVRTLSNAMDVGAPSNFVRMTTLFNNDWNTIKDHISGYTFSDEDTQNVMREVKNRTDYILDPHGAVAYLALKAYQKQTPCTGIFLETAHPAKFLEDVTAIFGEKIKLPPALAALETKEKTATAMPNDFLLFKQFLLTNF